MVMSMMVSMVMSMVSVFWRRGSSGLCSCCHFFSEFLGLYFHFTFFKHSVALPFASFVKCLVHTDIVFDVTLGEKILRFH